MHKQQAVSLDQHLIDHPLPHLPPHPSPSQPFLPPTAHYHSASLLWYHRLVQPHELHTANERVPSTSTPPERVNSFPPPQQLPATRDSPHTKSAKSYARAPPDSASYSPLSTVPTPALTATSVPPVLLLVCMPPHYCHPRPEHSAE